MRSTKSDSDRYARCIKASKKRALGHRRGRDPGPPLRSDREVPARRAVAGRRIHDPSDDEKRFVSQIQGRTYANVFGLAERFINAKVLELSRDHWLGDQVALEALVRFSDEELKHQALFRRIEEMIGEVMPAGYRFDADPDAVAGAVLGKSTWAVLALTLDIELFTQLHYRQSIEPDAAAVASCSRTCSSITGRRRASTRSSTSWRWVRHDAGLTAEQRDRASTTSSNWSRRSTASCRRRPAADAGYFAANCGRTVDAAEAQAVEAAFLKAYRWQYIHSGAQHPHFGKVLTGMVTEDQRRPHPAGTRQPRLNPETTFQRSKEGEDHECDYRQ